MAQGRVNRSAVPKTAARRPDPGKALGLVDFDFAVFVALDYDHVFETD
ncbi:MAG: hypothetical protein V3U39_00800 [Acidimicrobiia bacterium]